MDLKKAITEEIEKLRQKQPPATKYQRRGDLHAKNNQTTKSAVNNEQPSVLKTEDNALIEENGKNSIAQHKDTPIEEPTEKRIKKMPDAPAVEALASIVKVELEGIECRRFPEPSDLEDVFVPLACDVTHIEVYFPKVLAYLQRILWRWACDLDARPIDEKRTAKGRAESELFLQTEALIGRFTRAVLQKNVDTSISVGVFHIVKHLQRQEYVRANDEYLKLSIGNSPWPIGVTMVGIHERTARQRIQSNQIAHVLNDEQTRKWIQSIKRLMTVCQKMYPNADPSKMIG